VVILLIAGYSALNEKNYGFNGISVVSNNNQMDVIFKAGIYKYGNEPKISAAITSNSKLKPGVAGINIMKLYSPDRMHDFIIGCIKNRPGDYLRYIGSKLNVLKNENIFIQYANYKPGPLATRVDAIQRPVFYIPFRILWWFLALTFITIIAVWIKRKQLPWLNLVLWLLSFAQIAVAILGGYVDYQRLILPAIPTLILLLSSGIDWVLEYKRHVYIIVIRLFYNKNDTKVSS
jgi:hypothetical protein